MIFLLYFVGVTLTGLLTEIEENIYNGNSNEHDIVIMPPTNANEDLIDKDSGDYRDVTIGNLPAFQLLAEADILELQNEENQQNNERDGEQSMGRG
ncbi:hypothetical protein GWI33_004807 [Rhynchophorus ferrugineus]|uniref:Uncharacterized protein n=1 Tax=Rhynchophorus ferrugineus TaxID=354439 RepID=A0A834IIE6_RHYFE|nr:hypothetical protein GWI33_004807 [Rhynchophorus ferrugineus]